MEQSFNAMVLRLSQEESKPFCFVIDIKSGIEYFVPNRFKFVKKALKPGDIVECFSEHMSFNPAEEFKLPSAKINQFLTATVDGCWRIQVGEILFDNYPGKTKIIHKDFSHLVSNEEIGVPVQAILSKSTEKKGVKILYGIRNDQTIIQGSVCPLYWEMKSFPAVLLHLDENNAQFFVDPWIIPIQLKFLKGVDLNAKSFKFEYNEIGNIQKIVPLSDAPLTDGWFQPFQSPLKKSYTYWVRTINGAWLTWEPNQEDYNRISDFSPAYSGVYLSCRPKFNSQNHLCATLLDPSCNNSKKSELIITIENSYSREIEQDLSKRFAENEMSIMKRAIDEQFSNLPQPATRADLAKALWALVNHKVYSNAIALKISSFIAIKLQEQIIINKYNNFDQILIKFLRFAHERITPINRSIQFSWLVEISLHYLKNIKENNHQYEWAPMIEAVYYYFLAGFIAEENKGISKLIRHFIPTERSNALVLHFYGRQFRIIEHLKRLGDAGYRLKMHDQESRFSMSRFDRSANKELILRPELPNKVGMVVLFQFKDDVVHSLCEYFARNRPNFPWFLLYKDIAKESVSSTVLRNNLEKFCNIHRGAFISETETLDIIHAIKSSNDIYKIKIDPFFHIRDDARDMDVFDLINRPAIESRLLTTLMDARKPVAVSGMRKAGKTATGKLLAKSFGFSIADEGRDMQKDLRTDPSKYIKRLESVWGNLKEQTLLILDEFDTFANTLGRVCMNDEGLILDFLMLLERTAQRHLVLLLGLDSAEALVKLVPSNNPFQKIPKFRLPLFDLAETKDFFNKLTINLRFSNESINTIWLLSGGHPIVMRELVKTALKHESGFRGEGVPEIPEGTIFEISSEFQKYILSPLAFEDRGTILHYILSTEINDLTNRIGILWKLINTIALVHDDKIERDQIVETILNSEYSRLIDPYKALDMLLDWGMLKQTKPMEIAFGVPLLRIHLRFRAGIGYSE